MPDTSLNSNHERSEQRQLIRDRRKAVPGPQKSQAELRLAQRLWQLAPYQRARHLSIYFAVDGELSLEAFMVGAERRNKQLYAPVLRGDSLRFAALRRGVPLQPNRFGILEPADGPYIDARSLDLVLTPLVAFDDQGVRLGMGGGFYDRCFRFLRSRSAWWKPKLIGVGYESQHVPSIDAEAWDVRLWCAVTETDTYYF
ncbi:MAG: 5-formyltetrahydrofolate cyclo-ligase [Gammaproteobacteria bacterium]